MEVQPSLFEFSLINYVGFHWQIFKNYELFDCEVTTEAATQRSF